MTLSNQGRKILAIIPARGGSKGIPRKNLAKVNDKPLIGWSIETMLDCLADGLISKAIVSTDDPEITAYALKQGAEVPFTRPQEFASDSSKTVDVLRHALLYFEAKNETFDAVLLLQPTSPLRSKSDVADAISLFWEHGRDSLISTFKNEQINELVMYHRDETFKALPLSKLHNKGVRRQDHQPVYVRNGAIYISTTDLILTKNLVIGEEPTLFEMPRERSINIDCPDDLLEFRRLCENLHS
jgi:CMP-N,N'-diacetyllegionaminic acid synthase